MADIKHQIAKAKMTTEISTKNELLKAIDHVASELLGLMSPLNKNKVNIVPYKGSWTEGQLFRHVSKSTDSMSEAIHMKAKSAIRQPGERIPELKKMFLDFSSKMKSPDFIVPEEGPYEKQSIVEELSQSFETLGKHTINKCKLN